MSRNSNADVWSDPRITAYALGELSAHEAEHFEQAIEADPALAEAVDEAKQLIGMLGEQYTREPLPSLEPSRRETVWREIASVPSEKPYRYHRRPHLMRLALLAASILLPIAVLGYWQLAPDGRPTPLALDHAADRRIDSEGSDAAATEAETEVPTSGGEQIADREPSAGVPTAETPVPMLKKLDSDAAESLRFERREEAAESLGQSEASAVEDVAAEPSRAESSGRRDDAAFGMSAEAADASRRRLLEGQASGYGGMPADAAGASSFAVPSEDVSPEEAGPPAPVEMRLQELGMQTAAPARRGGERFRSEDAADRPPAGPDGEVDGIRRRSAAETWYFDTGAAEKLRAVLIEARRMPEPDEVDVRRMINEAAPRPLALGVPAVFPTRSEAEIAQCPWQPGHALMLRNAVDAAEAASDVADSVGDNVQSAERVISTNEGFYRIRPVGEPRDGVRMPLELYEIVPASDPTAESEPTSELRRGVAADPLRTAIPGDRLDRPFADAGPTFRRVAIVAAFGLQLQRSERRGRWTLSDVLEAAEGERQDGEDAQWDEWIELIRAAASLEKADADAP